MKSITAAKRYFVIFAFAASATSLWFAVPTRATEPCPLPADSTASSTTSQSNDNSPGGSGNNEAVLHNGKNILCLPAPAAAAHMRHGDPDMGPCGKPGNQK